jgi:hypothetical protein
MGVLREADTEAETDTEKEKECVYLSLLLSL